MPPPLLLLVLPLQSGTGGTHYLFNMTILCDILSPDVGGTGGDSNVTLAVALEAQAYLPAPSSYNGSVLDVQVGGAGWWWSGLQAACSALWRVCSLQY